MKVDDRAFKGLSRFLAPSAGGPLADRALAEKRITIDQLQECAAIQDRTGRPLDEILLERGYLTAQDLARFRDPALPAEAQKAMQDPRNVLGHYILVARAGMGGMAEVWKSWDRSLGRWVAVKFLKEEIGHPTQRIEREGKMAGQMSHPGILTIYERGLHENRPYLVMPLVDGTPPKTPLPPKDAARLALQIAQALVHVHKMKIIHRDVKPANILVETGGRVFLVDFGLAIPDSSGASRWAVSGTPEYASPEQIQGGLLDARTDVYSLGATLYHLLSGRPPFSGQSVEEITNQVLKGPLPALKGVPGGLRRIVAKAMERDRAKRYPSMSDMARELESHLDPIWGGMPSTPKALVAILIAGALPWLITGIIAWQRGRKEERLRILEAVHVVDQELNRTEQLFADPEVPLDRCNAMASEILGLYGMVRNEQGQESPEMRLGIARCLELMNRDAEAQTMYTAAGSLPAAKLGLARVLLRRDFDGRKDKDWRKEAAKVLGSLSTPKVADVSTLLVAFASGRFPEVLSAAPRLLDQGRHDDVFQLAVGVAAVSLSRWEEALLPLEQAARLRRMDATSLYWKGVALTGKGDRIEAVTAFDQAIRSASAEWPLMADAQRRIDELRR